MDKNRRVETATGYFHHGYAESFGEFGQPAYLPGSSGWILQRAIPHSTYEDAIGCYPFFVCRDWTRIAQDLAALRGQLVSLAIVTDPFGDYTPALLQRTFDRVLLFKEHFVIETGQPLADFVSKHHRYYVRKALRQVTVEQCDNPLAALDEWIALYETLKTRHHLKGIKGFSPAAFAKQVSVPGLVLFRAQHEARTVAMHLWYLQQDVAYSHLQATSPIGYQLMATYPLYAHAIEWLSPRVRWIHLGAGAGLQQADDGLTQFKQGWATGTRPAYFCGHILNPTIYEELSQRSNHAGTAYFPAYRNGELG